MEVAGHPWPALASASKIWIERVNLAAMLGCLACSRLRLPLDRRGFPLAAFAGCPGIAGIAVEHMQLVGQPIALQPAESGFQLGQRHLRAALVAGHAFQRRVVAVIQPGPGDTAAQSSTPRLVLDGLCGDHLAQLASEPALHDGERLDQRRLQPAGPFPIKIAV